MSPTDRWSRIERLYFEAVARDAPERAAYLAQSCGDDAALRQEVESLLAHDGGAAFLDTPALLTTDPGGVRAGQAIGPYVIRGRIGQGGMGEVYRARDTKLQRDVAIKIVPEALITDPDRVARFEREARVLASLNHPRISAIYGVEDSSDVRALSTPEFVEGETLADIVDAQHRRGTGLPTVTALEIIGQIAEALEAAHERGVVHRDLKPANIKVTATGEVKVLDFGLAKLIDPEPANPSFASDAAATREGLMRGTAAYMSPEQARGHAVDKRTDIWAFGCIFYELLTGRTAFGRPTLSDTIAAVLEQEPDWAALPAATPPYVVRLLERCLDKSVRGRYRDIGDVRIALMDGVTHGESGAAVSANPDASRWWRRPAAVALAAAAVAVIAFGAGALVFRPPSTPAKAVSVRFPVFPPPGHRFVHTVATFPALSADGTQLAVIAVAPPSPPMIWVRPLSQLDARRVPGTEGARAVFWSPDGRSLAFFTGTQLKRIDLPDGAAVPLCDVAATTFAGTWGSDGTILFSSLLGDAIYAVSSAGGTPEPVIEPDAGLGEQVVWPSFLPDGKRFVYLSQRLGSTGYLMLGERGHTSRPIVSALSNVQWVEPGYLVFAQEGVLVAQRFDEATARVLGPVVSIGPVDRFLSTGRAVFTTSPNGTIAYHSHANVATLAWVDRGGKEIGMAAAPGDYLTVRLSSDDGTALFPRTRPGIGTWDLYTTDLDRNVETQLTSDRGSEAYPVWTSDGQAILFADGRNGGLLNLARKSLDTAVEEQLLPAGIHQRRPMDVSGETLLFTERSDVGTLDIWMLPLSNPQGKSRLFHSRFNEAAPRISRDGRAMSFISDESGRFEVYVAPFPPTGGKTQVSSGMYPGLNLQQGAQWSHDGRELFYVASDRRLMTVPVRTAPQLQVGSPSVLFEMTGRPWEDFAVTADGRRFLAVVPQAFAGEQPLTIMTNWRADIRP